MLVYLFFQVTFGQLKLMLRGSFNRSDKEQVFYPIYIHEALRDIQTRHSWACMRCAPVVTIPPGGLRTPLPNNFKELTTEISPIVLGNLDATGQDLEPGGVPCVVASPEEAERAMYHPLTVAPPGYLVSPLRVWTEFHQGIRQLRIAAAAVSPLNFKVRHYGFLAPLIGDQDTNYLTTNYSRLVQSQVLAVAFADVSDPVAGAHQEEAGRRFTEAVADDSRRAFSGRRVRMGG